MLSEPSAFLAALQVPMWLWVLAALAGYGMVMAFNPARSGLMDGLRALRRYRELWVVPALFGFAGALFHLGERAVLYWTLRPAERPAFLWLREAWRDKQYWLSGSEESLWWLPRAEWLACLRQSVAPAVEHLAGLFNCVVATFPLAALVALLLLLNRGGYHGVLLRALRKRFGHGAWPLHAGIVLCALAALLKPFLYLAPVVFRFSAGVAEIWFQWAPVVVWLSFLFEYLLGVFLQIALIAQAYVWVRGLSVAWGRLLEFALRRFMLVVKWAAVVLVLSSLFIEGPIILRNFAPFAGWFPEDDSFFRRLALVRMLLAGVILLGSTIQITLVFHSESLAAAWRDHWRFVRAHWWTLGWFLIVAALHCFALNALHLAVARGLGEGTAPWVLWALLYPWLAGGVLGWLLASWVCIYKRRDTPHLSAATQRHFEF